MKKSAVCAIIVNDELLLLQRTFDDYLEPGKFCYPGGKYDELLDKTAEDNALRETEEETSIILNDITYIKDIPSSNGFYIISVFYKIMNEKPSVHISSEHVSYDWFNIYSLDYNILAGNTGMFIDEIKKILENENK